MEINKITNVDEFQSTPPHMQTANTAILTKSPKRFFLQFHKLVVYKIFWIHVCKYAIILLYDAIKEFKHRNL